MTKLCTKCKIEKDISLFNKSSISKDGYGYSCKECIRANTNKEKEKESNKKFRDINKNYYKEYRLKNKEKLALYKKTYKENNKSEISNYNKKYRIENSKRINEYKREYRKNNEEKYKEYEIKYKEVTNKYREENKDKIREVRNRYFRERKKVDIVFKISSTIRSLISNRFKSKSFLKGNKTCDIIGCDFVFFKSYLESKFEDWMDWDNYGKYNGELNYGWDLDHIIPLSSAVTEEDVYKLNHYSNLQPLCSKINRDIKKDYIM